MAHSYFILYNPLAGGGTGKAKAEALKASLEPVSCRMASMTEIKDYSAFYSKLQSEEKLVLCGGDGTLNRFINDAHDLLFERPVWYYACGSGNDFWKDIGHAPGDPPADITCYLAYLPTVSVNGETRYFLNGIGYGIDGYCCEIGDSLRKKQTKPVNYASIAIKGLLFHYKPTNAVVVADGKRYTFRKVWLAPSMNGRCYGGGMMPTPSQDRLDPDHRLGCMVISGAGRLRTLLMFPSIFKGEHIHYSMVRVMTGKRITVSFDRPTALQIDGETVTNVREYTVCKEP